MKRLYKKLLATVFLSMPATVFAADYGPQDWTSGIHEHDGDYFRGNDNGYAIRVSNEGTGFIGHDVIVEGGLNAGGILVLNGAFIELSGSSIITGPSGSSLDINNATARIGAGTIVHGQTGVRLSPGNSSITVRGSSDNRASISGIETGMYMGQGSTADLSEFNIMSDNMGIYIMEGSRAILKDGAIQSGMVGLSLLGGEAELDRVNIRSSMMGFELSGIKKLGELQTISHLTLRNSDVEVINEDMYASQVASLSDGAVLDVIDSEIVTDGIMAFRFSNSNNMLNGEEVHNTLNLVDSVVMLRENSSHGFSYAFVSVGGVAKVNMSGSIVKGSGALYYLQDDVNAAQPVQSGLDIVADNLSQLYGRGVIARMGMGATNSIEPIANVTLKNGSFWAIDGNTEVTGLVVDEHATLAFLENRFETHQNGFTNLRVSGNYTGNKGYVMFNTILEPSHVDRQGDHLTVEGDVYGTTYVVVRNRGYQEEIVNDGINLITVKGVAENGADAFVLKEDYFYRSFSVLASGPYVYDLKYQTNNGINEWSLFLLYDQTEGPDGSKNPGALVYGAGVPLYEVYPQVLRQLNGLSTLQQRVGERVYVGGQENIDNQGFWMRVEGSTGHDNHRRSLTRSNYDLDRGKTQIGVDFAVLESGAGSLIGGVYGQYGHAKTDVSSRYGYGDVKTDTYGFGATLTWYQDNGFYMDGQGQVLWSRSSLYSRSHDGEMGFDRHMITGNGGTGYVFGIESGRKFNLFDAWSMTPQVQLIYGRIDFDSFYDVIGARIMRKDGESLLGRMGVSVDRGMSWQSESDDQRRLKVYGIGNLYYEFLDGTEVTVSGVGFRNEDHRFWGGIGSGVSYDWNNDAYVLYGELNVRTAFADFAKSYELKGNLGLKLKF